MRWPDFLCYHSTTGGIWLFGINSALLDSENIIIYESMSQLDWKLRKIYDETMLINIRINITKTVLLPGVNTTDTMFWFNFQGAYVTNF